MGVPTALFSFGKKLVKKGWGWSRADLTLPAKEEREKKREWDRNANRNLFRMTVGRDGDGFLRGGGEVRAVGGSDVGE